MINVQLHYVYSMCSNQGHWDRDYNIQQTTIQDIIAKVNVKCVRSSGS